MKQNFNINNITRETIKSLEPYSSARDEYTASSQEMVFLDANENPFSTNVNRYPDPQQNLVKQELSKINNISVANILLGNGSDEVLDLIFRAFCEPNQDNVITLPPTYGMYSVLANINAIQNNKIALTKEFQPAVNQVLETANTKSKILFLCSPNNPTGNSFNTSEVETLLNNFPGLVVIDEAYIDFSENISWMQRLAEFPNLIITQTLSKAYGMAGIRLGVCYASAEIIAILNKIKPPYNVNALTQQKALSRLQNMEAVTSEINNIKEQRSLLISALKDVSYISKIYPSDANFLLLKVDDANQRYQQLIDKNIVIRNRSNQVLCEDCLRITVGTAQENQTLIQALKSL
ncbi:histidinol-phosphate transaminase [Oceanihabitans sp. 2_MG-2023]|uniref:histidinol-phosphate transaminase n=1 Tax=Oceanihabitans sp. 2_MG-2023 TaxID=3062661 RepID=UPI0026E2E554|nr:histidinol-phosphate transaminase [Oceanihabitans sp. 2_MG-2023]MDO6596745.1 histidinol-phosphate transaminase [Oceanihabitans sp. 2_MG-2023]